MGKRPAGVHDLPDLPNRDFWALDCRTRAKICCDAPIHSHVRAGLAGHFCYNMAAMMIWCRWSNPCCRRARGVLPETDVRFDVVPGSLHGGPAFETEENLARVFALVSAVLAPFGKAARDKAR